MRHYIPLEQIKALRDFWDCRPTGGTERERQAWRNGFLTALEAICLAQHSDGFQTLRERFFAEDKREG